MPNPGLDLVAGFFLGCLIQQNLSNTQPKQVLNSQWIPALTWPVGLVLLVISLSMALAIGRNVYLSATTTSLKGLLYNAMHFRPMDWRADYLPLGNWVAYALAASLIVLVIAMLKNISPERRSHWIFRPLMVGLAISAVVGLIQAGTGLGLPQAQLEFRKDAFGYAAMGMQPDLHAFAAHMLLGVVGLWGYFLFCQDE